MMKKTGTTKWWTKYFKRASEQELLDHSGASNMEEFNFDIDSCEDLPGYNAKHIDWLIAKDEYSDTLAADGYDIIELCEMDGNQFLGYIAGGRLYDVGDDIRDLIGLNESILRKRNVEKMKKSLKESVSWDDLTDVEKIVCEYYADYYIDHGYSIEDAVTQGCFDMMNDIDGNDEIDDYEDPDPRKIKSFLMNQHKASSNRSSKEQKKVLYVIQDKHGNQLSAPSEDDYELWDRVAAMEARGRRGLCVVAYTEDLNRNNSIKGAGMRVKSLNEVKDDKGVERYGINGEWWYFTTHGVQPGSVPKGIEILDVIDTANGTYFCSDRVLNTSELRYYDIKEKYPKGLITEDTINKQFRKDIKRKYKDNQFINSVNKEKRADTMSMVKGKGLDKDPAFMKFVKDHMDDKYPLKPFKYKFPKHLEKNDFPFYVTYYQEYPIYEPAEGGYYYPGRDAIYSKGFDTKEEAEAHVEELKNEDGEGGWEKYSDGYVRKGKYVGDAEEIVIETRKTYLSQEKGWKPYQ